MTSSRLVEGSTSSSSSLSSLGSFSGAGDGGCISVSGAVLTTRLLNQSQDNIATGNEIYSRNSVMSGMHILLVAYNLQHLSILGLQDRM